MSQYSPRTPEEIGCGPDCDCKKPFHSRRDVLKAGAMAAGVLAGVRGISAEVGDIPAAAQQPPDRAWFEQLTESGEPLVRSGGQLENLIFPIGGLGTGTFWIHGSGKLVNWQIFNNIQKNSFVDDTFFAVRVDQEGKPPMVRVLQSDPVGPFVGIEDIEFLGRYPHARLSFRDAELPVDLELEAFNPLVPLDEKASGIPCGIFTLRAINKTDDPVRVTFLTSLQNAVGHEGKGSATGIRHNTYGGNVNRVVNDGQMAAVSMRADVGKPAEISPPIELTTDHQHFPVLANSPVNGLSLAAVGHPQTAAGVKRVYWLADGELRLLGASVLENVVREVREYGAMLLISGVDNRLLQPLQPTVSGDRTRRETLFESFDNKNYGRWTVEGAAFGEGPSSGTTPGQMTVSGFLGSGLVNTYHPNDAPHGKLTSPEFTIREKYISFLIGGGSHPGRCCINLLVDGNVVRTATGRNTEELRRVEWGVEELKNADARIEIVDAYDGGWGHVLVDDIRFSNLPIDAITEADAKAWNELLDALGDAGSMKSIGVGRGRVMMTPVELGTTKPGVDREHQRNRLLQMIADLVDGKFTPSVGRPETAPSFGTMCLSSSERGVTVQPGWTDRVALFTEFSRDGTVGKPSRQVRESEEISGPSSAGRTLNAAMSVPRDIAPNASGQATFTFTWHFPNQYYAQNYWRSANNTTVPVGNMYANWFHDATSAAKHVTADLQNLRRRTRAFIDAMYETTLPQYFVDAVAANISILRSPTCFWTKAGTFYGFEGCGWHGDGCCPMNCNHVWNYEQTLAHVWPSLERNMRVTELDHHLMADGGIHHRVSVPRENPHKPHIAVADGQCGAILKAYREYLQSADRRFLDDRWSKIKQAMEYAIKTWDPNEDGVMETPQFNTYDRVIYGHNTFVTSLYLAALRAAEEMAKLSKDDAAADRYRKLFESGRKTCAETLFDGEYYIQIADNINLGYGKGCWSDQVVGQWWARVLNLGDILPNDQVQSALKSIFRYSWLWQMEGFEGTQRFVQFADGKDMGLLCGSWPKGGRPDDPIFYRDECWTGIEYQVAAHKLYEGQIEEGLAIVKGVRDRYDGRKKSPWNEIECGDYYVRAMSSWSLLTAAQGYAHVGPQRELSFDPCLMSDDHESLFTASEGWGRFKQRRTASAQTNELDVFDGRCELAILKLGLPKGTATVTGQVKMDNKRITAETTMETASASTDHPRAVIRLTPGIAVSAGQTLRVQLQIS